MCAVRMHACVDEAIVLSSAAFFSSINRAHAFARAWVASAAFRGSRRRAHGGRRRPPMAPGQCSLIAEDVPDASVAIDGFSFVNTSTPTVVSEPGKLNSQPFLVSVAVTRWLAAALITVHFAPTITRVPFVSTYQGVEKAFEVTQTNCELFEVRCTECSVPVAATREVERAGRERGRSRFPAIRSRVRMRRRRCEATWTLRPPSGGCTRTAIVGEQDSPPRHRISTSAPSCLLVCRDASVRRGGACF